MLESIGRYRILNPLGKGAMGVVYLAADPLLNRQVAVKTIDLTLEEGERRDFLRGRLLRDARAAAALTHPNIVGVYDVVSEGPTAAIVMEYVEGENLAAYLARNPIPDTAFTLRIVRAMAAALDYTHGRGVIHRDIKPANVMLDSAQTPKITDFGIARITEGATATMTGLVMGTIEYMAPEQIKGETVEGPADQFALAVVAYRMLTAQSLFGDHSMATLAYKIVNENPAPVCSINSRLPAAVDAALGRALAKDPQARYASCSEFADALTAALMPARGETTVATAPSLPPAPTIAATAPPMPSKSKIPVIVVAALAAVGAVAGVLVWKPWAKAPAATVATQANLAQPVAPPLTPEPAPAKIENAPKDTPHPPPSEKIAPLKKPGPAVARTTAPADPDPADAVEASVPRPAVEAFNRGHDLIANRDYAGALTAFNTAVSLRPNWAQAYNGRASAYQGLQQYDAAVRDYTQAIRLNGSIAKFYMSRAECYVKQQQDDPALADLDRAVSLKPDAWLAFTARAELYMRRRAPRKAVADWDEVIRLRPEDAFAYGRRAIVRRNLGDQKGSAEDNRKAAALNGK